MKVARIVLGNALRKFQVPIQIIKVLLVEIIVGNFLVWPLSLDLCTQCWQVLSLKFLTYGRIIVLAN
jgi:hypothetical protein